LSKQNEDINTKLNEKLNKIKEDGLKLREDLEKLRKIRDEKNAIISRLKEIKPDIHYSENEILQLQNELIEIEKRIETTVMKKGDEEREYEREKEIAKRLESLKAKKRVSDERNMLINRLKELSEMERPLRDNIRKLIEEREGLKKEVEVLRIKEKLMKYKEKEKEESKVTGISVRLGDSVNREKLKKEIMKKLQEGQPLSFEELKIIYGGNAPS